MDTNELIIVKGQDKTFSIKKWNYNEYKNVIFITYANGKSYPYSLLDVDFYQNPQNMGVSDKRVYCLEQIKSDVETVQLFGPFSRLIFKNGHTETYCSKDIKIVNSALNDKKSNCCFQYLKEIANAIGLRNENNRNILAAHYDKIDFVSEESVLATFLSGKQTEKVVSATKKINIIYPFGFNLSQQQAVENAMKSEISVIEGPPGTGKTQTILNIIANAVIRGETVAVVSSNNSATDNVYDKLKKYGVEFIAAKLGNVENQVKFTEEQITQYPQIAQWSDKPDISLITKNFIELHDELQLKNNLSVLLSKEDTLKKEKLHFDDYCKTLNLEPPMPLFSEKISINKILNFSEEYEYLVSRKRKIGFFKKMALRYSYKLKNADFFGKDIKEISAYCQSIFYERKLKEIATQCLKVEQELKDFDFDKKMEIYVDLAMKSLKNHLYNKFQNYNRRKYTVKDLKIYGEQFIRDYPVVLSTTYSISSSLSSNICYDYLIVDEASQVDLVTGALALSCAKKVVIVGDLKQLPNVVNDKQKQLADEIYTKYNLPKAYRYCDHSLLLSTIELFPDAPKTMLREHYRCQPEIIEFCNQMFYNNELVVMTNRNTEKQPMIVYRTAAGNMARGHYNQRQIDVIKNEVIPQQHLNTSDSSVGIITPYRVQADCLQKEFDGTAIKADTVDKFQGQERSVIILSTVDNEIGEFVSNPNRLNVAVSRAVDRFIVVTDGNDNDKVSPVHELIEYIHYHNHDIVDSKINSVFDYLYEINVKSREEILKKYGKSSEFDSENLVFGIIKDILTENRFSRFNVAMHVPFRLLLGELKNLTQREIEFATNDWTHVDFLIFSKLSHLPNLVIEVDGFTFHNNEKQKERDRLKDTILTKYGIPILRLNTVGSNERDRIREKLLELIQ